MTKETRAVAYARVSSREQAEKELSIPAQLDAMRAYCKQKGWKLVHEYVDAGKSAKSDERPAFQHMIAMAKKASRSFDVIVVHKFDRFSRNRNDHVIYKSLLRKIGVNVFSVTEQTDPDTPHGFLIEGILEVISEFYNMNLKNEVMKGMRENAIRGFHNGGRAPYGYRIEIISEASGSSRSVLVPGEPEEVATVQKLFHYYVYEGCGYKKLANMLNEEGTPSPSGGKWSYSSIHYILHSEVYIGNAVWNKHDYSAGKRRKPEEEMVRNDNAHQALISRELFDLVQQRSKTRVKNSNYFEATNTPYILRGLLKCPFCGTNMVSGQSGGKKRNTRRYYVCGAYQRKGKSVCKFRSLDKEGTEGAVIDALVREMTALLHPGILAQELERFAVKQTQKQRMELSEVEKEIELTKMRIELLQAQGADDDKYLQQLESSRAQLQIRQNLLQSELSETRVTVDLAETVKNQLRYFIDHIRIEPSGQQNALLKQYVHSVTLNLASQVMDVHMSLCAPDDKRTLFEKHLFASQR